MTDKLKSSIGRFKYTVLALVLGLAIMLLPSGTAAGGGDISDEQRLASVLESCEGVGSARVLLSDTGAVIVCDGAGSAAVRLSVIKAAEAFTGFKSDSIQVIKTAPNIGG